MNDKIIQELEKYIGDKCRYGEMITECADGLYEILSRAQAEQGDGGLRAKIENIILDSIVAPSREQAVRTIVEIQKALYAIPSPKDEPLAKEK